ELLLFGPHLLLHLGGVDFLDSSGLGLLVRYAARTRNANGRLKLCALSSKVSEVLRVTHLEPVLESYGSETEAVASFYWRDESSAGRSRLQVDVLCVDASADVQAYVRELLAQEGFGVLTAGNLPDALILLQTTRPRIVVVSTALRRARDTR